MSPHATEEMTCQEFVELVTDLIEGQVTDVERLAAEAHLGECDGCATYLEQMRQSIAALRRLAEVNGFPATREYALAAFRELRVARRDGSGAGP
jgi:anti-sigma factor RsiW